MKNAASPLRESAGRARAAALFLHELGCNRTASGSRVPGKRPFAFTGVLAVETYLLAAALKNASDSSKTWSWPVRHLRPTGWYLQFRATQIQCCYSHN